MGTEGENFEIRITTPYDGTGAKQAQADLERTKAEAESAIGGKLARDPGQVAAAAQMNAEASKATAISDAEAAQAEARKTLEIEKQLVIATRQSMLEAAIAGDQTELAKLRTELSVRQLTVQTLSQEQMSQEQINALLADQNTLIEAGNAAVAERAAAEAAAAEAESGTVYGPRNRYARLARNFGFDANSVASAGIGLMIGLQLKQLIDHMSEEMDKQTSLRNKESEQLHDQVKSLNDQIRSARSVEDLIKARQQAEAEIGRLQQERVGKEGQELIAIDARIHMLQTEIGFTGQLADGAKDRKTEEERVAEALTRQLESYDKIKDDAEASLKATEKQIEFENKKADLLLKIQLQKIDAARKDGTLGEVDSAKQIAALTGKESDRKFAKDLELLEKKKDTAKTIDDAETQKRDAAQAAEKAANDKLAAVNKALVETKELPQSRAASVAGVEEAWKKLSHDREMERDTTQSANSRAVWAKTTDEDEAEWKKRVKANDALQAHPTAVKDAQKAVDTALAEAKNAAAASNSTTQEYDRIHKARTQAIADLDDQIAKLKDLHKLESDLVAGKGKSEVAAAQRAQDSKQIKHLTPEEEADLARRQAPLGRQVDADVAEARSMTLYARGTAEAQEVLDAAKKVHEKPTDDALVGVLVGALQKMVTHVNTLDSRKKANVAQVERRLNQVINQLKEERNGH